ncbi:hypothetical protein FP2506_02704 [Fulvimarina pelagi HTCC2506]|uniref:Uncharacterized protein n=2 Tax=Fulvimarina pelagi TaxID=217511 RepID=Q0G0J2_9HYPH|nr:hypothetical protein [Fulvimarina pelagi]EAU40601.1 hypothetical protein FP2506_02704 [Fulvimarina pelagi HTCC2506]BAT31151.1 hypothetical protein [Fulvimarina pelagi]
MRDQESVDFFCDEGSEEPEAFSLAADPVATFSNVLTMCHLTPFVMAARVPKLFAETGTYSPFARDETRLAVVEKIGAAIEGGVSFQIQLGASFLAFQAAVLEGKFAPNAYLRGFGELPSSAMEPFVARLRANADRLA